MRRRRKEEKHENLDRWLLTYADMITLLMAFFIMMYSMSVLNIAKFRDAAFSIRSGFGGMMRGQGRSILGSSGKFSAKPSPIQGDTIGVSWNVIKPLNDFVRKDEVASRTVQLTEDQRGIVITMLTDRMLFSPGRADLRPGAYPLLDRIAEALDRVDNNVQVVGHTCDLKPRGSHFSSNLQLSLARAQMVLHYLEHYKGLESERFSVAGYGSTMPICPNKDEANRRRNRRVEIVILRPEAPPVEAEVQSKPAHSRPVAEIRRRSN